MKSEHLIRTGRAALAFGLLVTTAAGALLVATIPAGAAATPQGDSSAVTVTWAEAQAGRADPGTPDPDAEAFSKLAFTVSQTRDLVDQGITVSWTGGARTSASEYATDYLQIMQCWGDEAAGPSPQQCQWGAPASSIGALMGVNAAKRDLTLGSDPVQDAALVGEHADPDLLLEPPVENPFLKAFRMPFRAVDGSVSKTTTDLSKQFDQSTTNEVTAARTASNGTGQVSFETQTSLGAPQLGCGADQKTASGSVVPRSCWLVIVPRGEHNLDGTPATATAAGRVTGSPLSASAWRNRVVVKLGFQSVSQSCPIGNAEQRLVGSETIAEAITSWQPSLCRLGTTYGYSQIGDLEAQHQIVSTVAGSSRLAVVNSPLDPAITSGTSIAYAPLAQNAIVVAFSIDYRLYPEAPAADRNGLQARDLTLNARLVAKLLTQSYRYDVPGRGAKDAVLQKNAASLVTDPEFLALNPTFADSKSDTSPAGLMVALGSSDATARVWAWLRADPLADGFLQGRADEWGMKLNPSYLPLSLGKDVGVDSFPKADLTIAKGGDPDETGYGTLDMRPYMNDMHEGAYRTLKADPNEKDSWNPYGQPKGYVSVGAQIPGSRFLLSVTDAASAARYGLPTARLVNGAGQAVAATNDSVAKGIQSMKPSAVPGVSVADPTSRALDAYPLAMLSYAAVNVCASTPAELADYSRLISYAVGKGQAPGDARGDLPAGYVPLAASAVGGAQKVAAGLVNRSAVAAACPAAPVATPEPTPAGSSTDVPPGDDPSSVAEDPAAPEDAAAPPTQAAGIVPVSASDPDQAQVPTQHTTDKPLQMTRMGLAGALAVGIPALAGGPLLTRRGRKLAALAALESE